MNLHRSLAVFSVLIAGVSLAQVSSLRVMAPTTPGGSWDVMARAIQDTLTKTGLAQRVEVYNVAGQSGTVGLKQFVGSKGDATQLYVAALGHLSGIAAFKPGVSFADATPIARLIGEYQVIAVPSKSNYRTLADLVAAFKANPESVVWSGSASWGISQLVAGRVAEAVGVNPSRVKFLNSSGNLKAAQAMVAGESTVVTVSYSAIRELVRGGEVRLLGITSPRRVNGIEAPTLIEQGVNVDFFTWMGVVAPAGISPAERSRLTLMFSQMVRSPEWKQVLEVNEWNPYYTSGNLFGSFLASEQERMTGLVQKFTAP